MDIDWVVLRAAAKDAAAHAYAKYSKLQVGAAGQDANGKTVTGCNVENASYGLTLCAECGLVSAQRLNGVGPLVAVSIVTADGAPLMPCGRCRQLLWEAAGAELMVDTGSGHRRLDELLPDAFTDTDLASRRGG